jgi:cysteinyl-tRNA synthetase
MELRIYNSLSRKKEVFVPNNKNEVSFYSCGPTVYHFQHIGNLRTMMLNDFLKRVLEFNNYKVRHVMNITDVGHLTSDADDGEDKMLKGLKREGLDLSKDSMLTMAQKYTIHFQSCLTRLNIKDPEVWCKATEHIPQMIDMVAKIKQNGASYESKSAVYFDISKFSSYGELTNIKVNKMDSGSRVEIDSEKKNPQDFVLWFKAVGKHKNHLMIWDSPYGLGFPGWHIECSAMATYYLGEKIDIHTGGEDLRHVHHTNEVAQSESATGSTPWVKYWLHGGFVIESDGSKMAKSKGDFLTLDVLEEKGYNALDYRYLCLGTHYRKQLTLSWGGLDSARASFNKLKNKTLELKSGDLSGKKGPEEYIEAFQEAINNDLNLPMALAVVWEMLKDEEVSAESRYDTIIDFDRILGLDLGNLKFDTVPENVKQLVGLREHARIRKEFDEADTYREKIEKLGYNVQDSLDGPIIKKM